MLLLSLQLCQALYCLHWHVAEGTSDQTWAVHCLEAGCLRLLRCSLRHTSAVYPGLLHCALLQLLPPLGSGPPAQPCSRQHNHCLQLLQRKYKASTFALLHAQVQDCSSSSNQSWQMCPAWTHNVHQVCQCTRQVTAQHSRAGQGRAGQGRAGHSTLTLKGTAGLLHLAWQIAQAAHAQTDDS